LVLVVVALALGYRFGVFAQLAEPRPLAQTLVAMGAWGYFAFILSYTVLQPFGVPGTVFIVAAPLIWPWQIAFALSMVGTMAASVVGFSFARFVARDWISARIPARFRKARRSSTPAAGCSRAPGRSWAPCSPLHCCWWPSSATTTSARA
jgi:uncharacterized membrane protein YdjX (TVP38/TMEM64 family)